MPNNYNIFYAQVADCCRRFSLYFLPNYSTIILINIQGLTYETRSLLINKYHIKKENSY